MHHRNDFLLLPFTPNDLHAHRQTLHQLWVIYGVLPVEFCLEQLRTVVGCGAPFVSELVQSRVNAGDGDDADRAIDNIVLNRGNRKRRELVATSEDRKRRLLTRNPHQNFM